MAKYCDICGKTLSFGDSFYSEGKHVCRDCQRADCKNAGDAHAESAAHKSDGELSAYSFNGIGTTYYGHKSVTIASMSGKMMTMWVTFLWVPIIPVLSIIVWKEAPGPGWYAVVAWKSSKDFIASRISLCWPHILNVYIGWSIVISLLLLLTITSARGISYIPILELLPLLCIVAPIIYISKFWRLDKRVDIFAILSICLAVVNLSILIYYSL